MAENWELEEIGGKTELQTAKMQPLPCEVHSKTDEYEREEQWVASEA